VREKPTERCRDSAVAHWVRSYKGPENVSHKKTGRFRGPFSMRGKRIAYFSLASARSASALSVFSHENAV